MKKKDLKLWAFFVPSFKKLFVLFLLILIVFVFSGCEPNIDEESYIVIESTETVVVEETPTPTLIESSVTSTVEPTETLTPTPTSTITPTPTPMPYEEMSFEAFKTLASALLKDLIYGWWPAFDDSDVFVDYPGYNEGYVVLLELLEKEYERNSNLYFWCAWAKKGWDLNFSALKPFDPRLREREWNNLREWIGTEGKKPYCKEFDQDFTYDETYEESIAVRSSPIPKEDASYDWSEEERQYVFDNYLEPLIHNTKGPSQGDRTSYIYFLDLRYYELEEWGVVDGQEKIIEIRLSNYNSCRLIANHSAFTLELWLEDPYGSEMAGLKTYQSRNKVRKMIAEDLSELCPDFLDMIDPQFFPLGVYEKK